MKKFFPQSYFLGHWFAGALDDKLKGEKNEELLLRNQHSFHPEPSQPVSLANDF
jgi:hypothetical protein